MSTIEESIEVRVPLTTAYNQWTQFEEFPQFMEGVEEVRQLDDTHLHWRAEIAGKTKEWDAVIVEQRPDDRVAWANTAGARNAGMITFHRISDDSTGVKAQMDVAPEGFAERAGDAFGIVKRRVKADLERFKDLIESQGFASGGWRGVVKEGERVVPHIGAMRDKAVHRGTGTRASEFEPHR
jgi:uncharacterized membrane protein